MFYIKWLFCVLFAGLTAFFLHFDTYDKSYFSWFIMEDGILEWTMAMAYLFSSSLFFYGWYKRGFKNIWFLGYALLFFLVFAEEISWGQRIFGIETPDALYQVNVQREMNIHNIMKLHNYMWLLGLSVVSVICYVIPLSNRFSKKAHKLYNRVNMPLFPLWCIPLPTVAVFLMAVPRLGWGEIPFVLDEIGEFCISMGFLFFALQELKGQKRP